MEREILHLVVPAFPIALARTGNARLRRRPVAVAPASSDRALLQCVSAEAAAEGIFPGQPVFRARRMCPSLTVIPPDPLLVSRGTRALAALAAEFTPLVEPGGGRLFLDLTGSRRLFGPARDVAVRLESAIAGEIGVPAQAGSGANKLVTRIAADALPEAGVYDVFQGSERSFLAPFPVSVLPGIGTGRETLLFRDLNLAKVADLAALSVAQLRLAVGAAAPLLHERAMGIDRSPVQPPRRTTEIVEESFLGQEENDDEILLAELFRLVEGCGLRLRRIGRQTDRISLTVCYADGVAETGKKVLTMPESLDLPLFAAVEALFHATCRRRVRVRSLRLACCRAAEQRRQLDLFAPESEIAAGGYALQETMDRLRERYGAQAVCWGRTLPCRQSRDAETCPDAGGADLSEYRYHTLTTRGGF